MGNYIEIQDQLIRLRKKESLEVTTPAKAINEAIEFCKVNNLTECELDYDGFLFDIEPTSDLKEKLSDFNRARAERTNENSGLHLQNVSGSACPKCGCQIYSPFGDGRLMHDVNSCGGIVAKKEGDITILP